LDAIKTDLGRADFHLPFAQTSVPASRVRGNYAEQAPWTMEKVVEKMEDM